MAKWIIIEDRTLKALALINACLQNPECASNDSDEIICLLAQYKPKETSDLSRFKDTAKNISIMKCQSKDVLIDHLKVYDGEQLNIFLDVGLIGIQEDVDFLQHNNELINIYRNIAHIGTNIICIYSTDNQPVKIRKSLGDYPDNFSNVFAAGNEIDGSSRTQAFNDAKSIVAELCLRRRRLQQSPLEKLWRESSKKGEEWFSKITGKSSSPIQHDDSDIEDTEEYKSIIDDAFGFEFPKSWFNGKSFEILHENIKSLCGESYIGINTSGENLSLGGILLIAMSSYFHIHNNINIFEDTLASWESFASSNKRFLLLQHPNHAKETALSFYDFFSTTFKDEHKLSTEFQSLSMFGIDNNLNKFFLSYSWEGNGIYDILKEEIIIPSNNGMIPFPSRRYNTRSCLRWISQMMLFQTHGFYHPGNIYMQGNDLYVSSTWS